MSEDKTVQVLDSIDFHGHGLTVVVRGGEPYVAMRSIVEGMGLTWPSQYQKMMDNKERWGVVMIVTPSQGGEQATVCMPLRKLTGWLMTLQPSRMEAAIAQRVLLYQHECDDALWAYWTKGMAVNPRVVRPNDSTLLGLPDFQDPVAAAEAWIEQYKRHKVAEAEVKLLVAKVQEDAPKVAFYEDFSHVVDTIPVGLMAKVIFSNLGYNIGQNRLFEYLRSHRFVHASGDQYNLPTQHSLDEGWFVVRTKLWKDRHGNEHESKSTQVTARGQIHFLHIFRALQQAEREARTQTTLPIFASPPKCQ